MPQSTLSPAVKPAIFSNSGGNSPPVRFVLRCEWCRRIFPLAYGELARYMREGWPDCCFLPMVCSTPSDTGAEE
ncbi:unnamed protein product [Gemmata massiliana]|uniref:Uncharacterized protein n=1 Tax=Gemmata massiliana TaxID=1210884 RepID=A0A6P2D054_9BACT|nr:unnamed protein product [Gemmata massiliana]